MSNDKTYNGWSNYETWCVNLWWSDCEATCDMMDDYAIECIQAAIEESDIENDDLNEVKQSATCKLSKLMEQYLDDYMEECNIPESSLVSDLLGAAVSEVNFYEIAKHYIYNNWDEVYSDYRADNDVEVEE